jgi:hypothetical protein
MDLPVTDCVLGGKCTHQACRQIPDEWDFDEYDNRYVQALEERVHELEERQKKCKHEQ